MNNVEGGDKPCGIERRKQAAQTVRSTIIAREQNVMLYIPRTKVIHRPSKLLSQSIPNMLELLKNERVIYAQSKGCND